MFVGCDPYSGREPFNYQNTRWVCSEPNIWFEVDNEKRILGEINIKGNIKSFTIMFAPGGRSDFYPSSFLNDSSMSLKDRLLYGDGVFGKKKFVIKIQNDTLFDNKYKELIFYREKEN
jgi:hypothetical protein